MLITDQINDLHHLYWAERWPIRKIEQHLRMSWHTIKKYLETPAQTSATRSRISGSLASRRAEWRRGGPG